LRSCAFSFEHPEVEGHHVFTGGEEDRIFTSAAGIYMLGMSTRFKVNFCKFTGETRLWLEEMSAFGGVSSGTTSALASTGGGYRLAIAA
jgi:benzoyl-CoA-dihydrodiol lyase